TQTIGRILVNNTTPFNAVRFNNDVNAQNQVTFIDGVIDLNGKTLTIGTNTLNGIVTGQNPNSYVNSNGGFVRIKTNTNATYVYPVGDSIYYTPYTITLNSGAVAASDIRVMVVDAPHPNLSPVIDKITRYWMVEPTGLLSNKNYNVSYQYAGAFEIIGAGPLFPVKYSLTSALPGWNGCPGSLVTAITGISGSHNAGTFTLQWDGLSDFSDFTAAGNNVPLPVELLTFDAIQQGNDVLVSVITASELNNDRFEVERSIDGSDFSWIGTVTGHGTTSATHSYSLLDKNPVAGINYYRLRQIDYDGTEDLSDPVAVMFNPTETPITVYHDHTAGSIIISCVNSAGRAQITLYDATGKSIVVFDEDIDKNWNHLLSLPKLAAGIYSVKCIVNDETLTMKLIQQ
ncbi:MAG: T9SS type A sorting domain-containing protein, partial [Bacteroidota bacterium]